MAPLGLPEHVPNQFATPVTSMPTVTTPTPEQIQAFTGVAATPTPVAAFDPLTHSSLQLPCRLPTSRPSQRHLRCPPSASHQHRPSASISTPQKQAQSQPQQQQTTPTVQAPE